MLKSFCFFRSELLNSALPAGSVTFCAVPDFHTVPYSKLEQMNVFTIQVKPKEERKENTFPAYPREQKLLQPLLLCVSHSSAHFSTLETMGTHPFILKQLFSVLGQFAFNNIWILSTFMAAYLRSQKSLYTCR